MSVDYDALYGIGYEVLASEEIKEKVELEDGLHEYVYSNSDKEFDVFETGCCLSGEMEGVFLVIPDALKYGLDLIYVKNKIESEARRLKLELVGDFGLVGGVYVS